MKNLRHYGLQLQAVQQDTYRLDWFTPRNLDVALAMAKGHAADNVGYWVYKIFYFGVGVDWEPIIFDTPMLEKGDAAAAIAAAATPPTPPRP